MSKVKKDTIANALTFSASFKDEAVALALGDPSWNQNAREEGHLRGDHDPLWKNVFGKHFEEQSGGPLAAQQMGFSRLSYLSRARLETGEIFKDFFAQHYGSTLEEQDLLSKITGN